MKRIVFIRHAKSDRSLTGIRDFDRPLNERGYADAHKMGAYIRDKISGEKIFVSSPAIRALSTALIFAAEIKYSPENILLQSSLYEAEISEYIGVIESLNDEYNTAFIFGHNPTISQVVGTFLKKATEEMPTCFVAVLNFKASPWREIKTESATLELQLFPKLLTE